MAHASIQNTTANTLNVGVYRVVPGINALTDSNAICWGVCYSTEVDTSILPVEIEAGVIDSSHFTGHVYPDQDGLAHTGQVEYVFYNLDDPTDNVSLTITYTVAAAFSLPEQRQEELTLFYPNPSTGVFNLDGTAHTSIRVISPSGAEVRHIKQVVNAIDLSDQPPGIYTVIIEREGDVDIQRLVKY